MGSIAIGQIDDGLIGRLRQRAAENGRTVEDEAREILCAAARLMPEAAKDARTGKELYEEIRAIYEPLGGRNLELPLRSRVCCEHVCSVGQQE